MEITFKMDDRDSFYETAREIEFLREIAGKRMHIGAGTVTSVPLVELAHSAGAEFIISPNVNTDVIQKTRELNMVSIPGALTPTEVLTAHDAGADFIKLFPAGSMGPEYLKALHDGPMGHILYIAASGVSIENIADYMAAGACGAGISSGIVKKEWIDTGKFEKITELAQQFISNANAG